MMDVTDQALPANPTSSAAVEPLILRQWRRLGRRLGGAKLFSWLVARAVPYAGTIQPEVMALEPGFARVRMGDRKRTRNHVGCAHAAALVNLGETTAGMAMVSLLPPEARFIVSYMEVVYSKKARGPITAECRVHLADPYADQELIGEAVLRDEQGDVVARVRPTFKISPKRTS